MTQEQKKTEVDAFLAEKDAMKRLKLEQAIAGQMRLQGVENLVPGLTVALVVVVLVWVGARGDINLSILILVVVLACAESINRWLYARRVNRQVAALREYLDLRLSEMERGGGETYGR